MEITLRSVTDGRQLFFGLDAYVSLPANDEGITCDIIHEKATEQRRQLWRAASTILGALVEMGLRTVSTMDGTRCDRKT